MGLLLILLLLPLVNVSWAQDIPQPHPRSPPELQLAAPQHEFRFDGGSIRIWRRDVEAFPDARVDVSEITFREDGLMVPQYADADGISYVLEGTGKVGVVFPAQGQSRHLHIRRVQRGDIVAIPKGMLFWWYNDGYGIHRIFCASDTSSGVDPSLYHQFSFSGARVEEFGNLLHGFSRETLAEAWGVEEGIVDLVRDSRNETSIVKTRGRIRLPDPRRQHGWRQTSSNEISEEQIEMAEFKYSMDREYPDLIVDRGGWMKVMDARHLPILSMVGMCAMRVGLEQNAVEAPAFFPNAHQIVYITRGSGRIEVSSNNGESLLASEVREGSVLVIPKYLPSIKVAGADGLSYLSFLTATRVVPSYITGRNSVYESIPKQVLAASFNVDEETLLSIRAQRRFDEAIFFPPRATS